jgi:hypothetical protein
MASLASDERCAAVLMAADAEHGAVAALMFLAKVADGDAAQQAGHVRAAAACALSFLSCHNMGARGDDCLSGPYRKALLQQGALVWRAPCMALRMFCTGNSMHVRRGQHACALRCACVLAPAPLASALGFPAGLPASSRAGAALGPQMQGRG